MNYILTLRQYLMLGDKLYNNGTNQEEMNSLGKRFEGDCIYAEFFMKDFNISSYPELVEYLKDPNNEEILREYSASRKTEYEKLIDECLYTIG